MDNELNNNDLSMLDIDFNRFRKDLVNFVNTYNIGFLYSINLKHRPNQQSDKMAGQHMSINTTLIDNLLNLEYIKDNINSVDQSIKECEYSLYNQEVIDDIPYVIECIAKIENHINIKFGRIRLFILKPRSMLPLHYDFGTVRYHIPIVTSDNCFFVSHGKLSTMPTYTKLYHLSCDTTHAAINFSNKLRLHLMLVSSNEDNDIDLAAHCQNAIITAKQYLDVADEPDLMLNRGYYLKLEALINELS